MGAGVGHSDYSVQRALIHHIGYASFEQINLSLNKLRAKRPSPSLTHAYSLREHLYILVCHA